MKCYSVIITRSVISMCSRECIRLFPPTTTLWIHSFTSSSDCNDGEKDHSFRCFIVILPTVTLSDLIQSFIWMDKNQTNSNFFSDCSLGSASNSGTSPMSVTMSLPTLSVLKVLLEIRSLHGNVSNSSDCVFIKLHYYNQCFYRH